MIRISKNLSLALRGIAILIVIASHYAEWMYVEPAHPVAASMIKTWGPPGVDIFFLLSGYGLYKSAKRGVDATFIRKRFTGMYLPYLIIAALINVYSGAWKEISTRFVIDYLTAAEFWYIRVLAVFYLIFIASSLFLRHFSPIGVCLGVLVYSIYLFQTGHYDFWILSNAAFPLGVCAAALEEKLPEFFEEKSAQLGILAVGLTGAVIAFFVMQKNGGSGVEESFSAELWMNVFIAVSVYGAALLIKDYKAPVLPAIGRQSLYIYLLHSVMFYALIFRLEHMGYAPANIITALITIAVCTIPGVVLSKIWQMKPKREGNRK